MPCWLVWDLGLAVMTQALLCPELCWCPSVSWRDAVAHRCQDMGAAVILSCLLSSSCPLEALYLPPALLWARRALTSAPQWAVPANRRWGNPCSS